MSNTKKQYARPELCELGAAQALTLGHVGCTPDGGICEKYPEVSPF